MHQRHNYKQFFKVFILCEVIQILQNPLYQFKRNMIEGKGFSQTSIYVSTELVAQYYSSKFSVSITLPMPYISLTDVYQILLKKFCYFFVNMRSSTKPSFHHFFRHIWMSVPHITRLICCSRRHYLVIALLSFFVVTILFVFFFYWITLITWCIMLTR